MKFRADRTEFAEAATWALRTVGTRASLPALSGVLLEVRGDRLVLQSTDHDMASELSIPIAGEREGRILVPGRLLGEVVRSLPAAGIAAEAEADRLHLACGSARFDLRLMPAEDFPPLPEPAGDAPTAVMSSEEFARTVAQVARAASTEDARPVLTGVLLEATPESLVAAATDSYRLAMRTLGWDQQATATSLVPRRALVEAQRAAESVGGDVRIMLEPSQVTFVLGARRLTSRLIEGKFPAVRQLLPSGAERVLEVDRARLMEVVRRVSVVGTESGSSFTPVTLHLSADTVRVTAGSGEVGQAEESLPGELSGEDLEIAFNPRYLTDGLDVTGGERVRLDFRDALKPAVMRPVDNGADGDAGTSVDFLYLLMPVRL